ncbi:NAD(P)/FAD-dependent oxidoreductase [Winogradskya humida]|uniref:FAD-binding domain-containing protein n=1 Tax=Winogradskya humida TaxID=113566 RepID=A0ABQ3ZJF8_9ACTN|nr:FAD-dependent monooxygenase [Actinoplanes humidus]GIE18730.1 hypothetical protein Ahu01nite_018320 [Actinoplanes humidus]
MTSAVVLGGGFAGVLAARVLAGHAGTVTVIESGHYPQTPGARPGVPQAHHNHVLVTGGARALDELIPGTVAALLAAGAHRRGLTGDALILSADGWFRRHETGAFAISCSRWLLDHVLRARALTDPRITVREGHRALRLITAAGRVTGVVVTGPDGRTEELPADLVVDATGRRSPAGRRLPGVEETVVDSGLAYSTRVYQAPAGLSRGMPAIMLHPRTTAGREGHGATLFPIERGRWIVTLTGTRGNTPPVDAAGFTACLAALGSPIVADVLAGARPIGPPRPYRATANRRRHFERRRTGGFLVLGDALVATNPVYSLGMSVAALSALRLDGALTEHGLHAAPALQQAVAAEADRAWQMAVAKDRPAPATVPAPLRALIGRSLLGSPALIGELFRDQTLLEPATGGLRTLAGPPPPLLSTGDAVAQFPRLGDWYSAMGRAT